jgi:hypothetical protein
VQDLEILLARVGLEVIHVLNLFMAFVFFFNLAKNTQYVCPSIGSSIQTPLMHHKIY